MSSEALLALTGLLFTIYSIMPTERRLDLRLRLRLFDWVLVATSLGALHYISYYPVLASIGVAPNLGPWRWRFTPDSASYLVVVGTAAVIWIRAGRAELSQDKLAVFAKLLDQLVASGRSADLVYLIDRHLARLVELERTHRPAAGTSQTPSVAYEQLRDIFRRLLTTRSVVFEIAVYHPALAVRLARVEVWDRWEYLSLLARALLDRRHGPLYYEVEHNQNLRSGHRYTIPGSNGYLSFFVGDAHRAHELRIYKEFGDYAVGELRRLGRDPDGARYNAALDEYETRERWACPVHACIRVFDVMLPEAIHQGVEWHMWLYYFPILADRVLENLSPAPDVELWREWPTPYHFLLYDVFGCLCNWLEESASMRDGRTNVAVRTLDLQHENESIAKSAALALGQVLRSVLLADAVDPGFRSYLMGMALRTSKEVEHDGREDLAAVIRRSIAQGGPLPPRSDAYPERLVEVFRDVDWLLRDKFRKDAHLGSVVEAASSRGR